LRLLVAPYTGVRVETTSHLLTSGRRPVAPYTGVRVETSMKQMIDIGFGGSPPTRGGGLKLSIFFSESVR